MRARGARLPQRLPTSSKEDQESMYSWMFTAPYRKQGCPLRIYDVFLNAVRVAPHLHRSLLGNLEALWQSLSRTTPWSKSFAAGSRVSPRAPWMRRRRRKTKPKCAQSFVIGGTVGFHVFRFGCTRRPAFDKYTPICNVPVLVSPISPDTMLKWLLSCLGASVG